jgi:hypothetical protein
MEQVVGDWLNRDALPSLLGGGKKKSSRIARFRVKGMCREEVQGRRGEGAFDFSLPGVVLYPSIIERRMDYKDKQFSIALRNVL